MLNTGDVSFVRQPSKHTNISKIIINVGTPQNAARQIESSAS